MKANLTDIVYYAPIINGEQLDKMPLEVICKENGDTTLRSINDASLVLLTDKEDFEEVVTKTDYYANELLNSLSAHNKTTEKYANLLRHYSKVTNDYSVLSKEFLLLVGAYKDELEENISLTKEIKAFKTTNYN